MSSDVTDPPSTEINLSYDGDRWVARDVKTATTRTGASRADALDALDAALEGRRPDDGSGIDPSDPFWDAEPVAAGGPTDLSERVDDYLYGDGSDEE